MFHAPGPEAPPSDRSSLPSDRGDHAGGARPTPTGRSLAAVLAAAAGLALALLLPGSLVAQDGAGSGPASAPSPDAASADSQGANQIVREGIRVELDLVPGGEDAGSEIRERRPFRLTVRMTDAETGEPVTEKVPALWVDHRDQAEPSTTEACRDRIGGYIQERMKRQPVVDLNSYLVVTLNRGNNLSVLNPFFGMGTTQTETTVRLPGEGADWALAPDETRLYVTIPLRNVVVEVDTDSWDVVRRFPVESTPTRMVRSPGGERLWVSVQGGDAPGMAVLDMETGEELGRIDAGPGAHRVAFRDDGEVAYVTGEEAGVVRVVDTSALETVASPETGPAPAAAAHSPVSGRFYVVDRADGSVTLLDDETHQVALRMDGTPGKSEVAFDPAGRWGFLLNRDSGEVLVLDAEIDRIRHGFAGDGRPYAVAFTERFAYVRSEGTSEVAMIPLRDLDPDTRGGAIAQDFGAETQSISSTYGNVRPTSFPAGQTAPGAHGDLGVAPPMTQAHHKRDALYVAAPGDKSVSFYKYMEGMPTPAGNLKTYAFEPKAVLTVGRSLDETSPGTYAASVQMPARGNYEAVFLLEEPRIVHCFPFEVASGERADGEHPDLKIASVEGSHLVAGTSSTLRFRLEELLGGDPVEGVAVQARLTSPRGWATLTVAEEVGDGVYQLSARAPRAGPYYLSVRVPEMKRGFLDQHYLVVRAVEPGS